MYTECYLIVLALGKKERKKRKKRKKKKGKEEKEKKDLTLQNACGKLKRKFLCEVLQEPYRFFWSFCMLFLKLLKKKECRKMRF